MRATAQAAAVGGAIAIILLLGAGGTDVDAMTIGDGRIGRFVAQNLTASPEDLPPHLVETGSALRYGRIGGPVLLWLSSAGDHEAMRFMQPLLAVLASMAIGIAMRRLFPGAGPWVAAAPFIAPGLAVSISGSYFEVIAIAFALWGVVAAAAHRFLLAALLLAAGTLTRESIGLVLIAVAVWAWQHNRSARPAALVLTGAVIPATWHLVVAARFGALPLMDPYVRGELVEAPGVGLYHSIVNAPSGSGRMSVLLHVAAAITAVVLARRSVHALAGSLAGLQLLTSTPPLWRFVGDSVRVSVVLEVTVILAVLAAARPAYASEWTLSSNHGRGSPSIAA